MLWPQDQPPLQPANNIGVWHPAAFALEAHTLFVNLKLIAVVELMVVIFGIAQRYCCQQHCGTAASD